MADVSSNAKWFINSVSQGNKRLARMDDYDVSDGSSKEAQNEVGSDVPTGITTTPGAYTIKFSFQQAKGAKPDVDWEYLKRTKEWHSYTKQPDGGRREQYINAQVSKFDQTGDKDGKHTYTVEIIALEKKPL